MLYLLAADSTPFLVLHCKQSAAGPARALTFNIVDRATGHKEPPVLAWGSLQLDHLAAVRPVDLNQLAPDVGLPRVGVVLAN